MGLSPLPFTLRQLQYAVAVADSLSFRRAAESCHVSQPSLSAQIAELEDALGVRLFERDRRRVLVTTAGRQFVERARGALREAEDLLDLARRAQDPLAGTVRLGVIPTISPYLLPRVAPALRRAHPRLTVLWTEDRTGALVRALEEGTLDGALLALEAELGNVEREAIAYDPFVLAAPSGSLMGSRKAPVRAAELNGATVLLLDDVHCLGRQTFRVCEAAGASAMEFRATSLSTITHMVAAGAGVTLLPEMSLAVEGRMAGLCVRAFAGPPPGRTIGLVWRPKSPPEPALRQVAVTIRGAYPRTAAAGRSPRPAGRIRASRGPASR